jgi:hypothetical protein
MRLNGLQNRFSCMYYLFNSKNIHLNFNTISEIEKFSIDRIRTMQTFLEQLELFNWSINWHRSRKAPLNFWTYDTYRETAI